MLKDYETVKKDARVSCVGLYFTNDRALRKVTRYLKHMIRSHGYVLFTDVNWIDKLCLVYYVPKA